MLDLDTHADRNIVVSHLSAGHVILTVRDKNTGDAIHAGLNPEETKAIADALTERNTP